MASECGHEMAKRKTVKWMLCDDCIHKRNIMPRGNDVVTVVNARDLMRQERREVTISMTLMLLMGQRLDRDNKTEKRWQ